MRRLMEVRHSLLNTAVYTIAKPIKLSVNSMSYSCLIGRVAVFI